VEIRRQKGFAAVIILVLIVLVVAGYFGYKYYLSTNKQSNQPAASSPTPVTDSTANWKTYTRNLRDVEGFSIKVPTTFTPPPDNGNKYTLSFNQQTDVNTQKPITPLTAIGALYQGRNTSNGSIILGSCTNNDDVYQQNLTVAKGSYTASNGKIQYKEITSTILGQVVKGIESYSPDTDQVNYNFEFCHNGIVFDLGATVDGNFSVGDSMKRTIDTVFSTFKFTQ
jgi:hypothetical protein